MTSTTQSAVQVLGQSAGQCLARCRMSSLMPLSQPQPLRHWVLQLLPLGRVLPQLHRGAIHVRALIPKLQVLPSLSLGFQNTACATIS